MVVLSTEGQDPASGYDKTDVKALLKAYQKLFEKVVEDDIRAVDLKKAINLIKESVSVQKRPPRPRPHGSFNHSIVNSSFDKHRYRRTNTSLCEQNDEKNRSQNGSFCEEKIREKSKNRLREILGKQFTTQGDNGQDVQTGQSEYKERVSQEYSRILEERARSKKREFLRERRESKEKENRSHLNQSRIVVDEPHDCIYRSKYKKYRQESSEMKNRVYMLQQKVKKYYNLNMVLEAKLATLEAEKKSWSKEDIPKSI